jgi:hypothetical protein
MNAPSRFNGFKLETVETVSQIQVPRNTALKRGVNETDLVNGASAGNTNS